jgi:hypothetical protein
MRAAAAIASGIPRLGQSLRLQRHALQLARGAQRASIFTLSAAVGRGRTSPLWDHLGTGRRFVQVEAGEVRKVSRPYVPRLCRTLPYPNRSPRGFMLARLLLI